MTSPDRANLIDRLTGGPTASGEDPRAAQFIRGLALGALVGAAIAGSTIWQRRVAKGRDADGTTTEDTSAHGDSEPT